MPGSGKQRVDRVTSVAKEEVPVQPSIGLHVADGGLNGRSSPQLTTHSDSEAASAAGDHHLAHAGVVVAAIALVDVDPLRLDTTDGCRLIQRRGEGVAVIGIAGKG